MSSLPEYPYDDDKKLVVVAEQMWTMRVYEVVHKAKVRGARLKSKERQKRWLSSEKHPLGFRL